MGAGAKKQNRESEKNRFTRLLETRGSSKQAKRKWVGSRLLRWRIAEKKGTRARKQGIPSDTALSK